MRIESLEQRVAKAPASLLCDECMHQLCCEYRESMKRVVVQTNDNCKPYPFKPNGWTCMHFYDAEVMNYPDNANYIQKRVDALADNTSAKYVRDAEVPSYDKADNV